MTLNRALFIMISILFLRPLMVSASLKVIYDAGYTQEVPAFSQNLAPHQAGFKRAMEIGGRVILRKRVRSAGLNQVEFNDFTPGRVKKRRLKHFYLSTPIFVVGHDAFSYRWLKTNATYFKKIHAIGIMSAPIAAHQLHDIEKDTGLILTYANLEGLSDRVKTRHIPFLIQKGWILQ